MTRNIAVALLLLAAPAAPAASPALMVISQAVAHRLGLHRFDVKILKSE